MIQRKNSEIRDYEKRVLELEGKNRDEIEKHKEEKEKLENVIKNLVKETKCV